MVFILWFLEKLLVIPVVLYCALAFQKRRKGSHALAQGNLSQKLDTQHLILHFKEHAEDKSVAEFPRLWRRDCRVNG